MNKFPDKTLKKSNQNVVSTNNSKLDKLKETNILNKEKSILINLSNALKSEIKEKTKNYKEMFLNKSIPNKPSEVKKALTSKENKTTLTKNINILLKKEESKEEEYFSFEKDKFLELTNEEKQIYGNRELKQNYQKMKLIGKGGCGIVWIGVDLKTHEFVAIKQICRKSLKGEINFNIGKREIQTLTNLNQLSKDNNENYIIKLLDYYEDSQDLWLIFERSGPTLNNLIFKIKGEFLNNERIYYIQKGRFFKALFEANMNLLKTIIRKIAIFLKFLSKNGIVHADIKPENILIDLDEDDNFRELKIIDFGSSFDINNPENFSSNTPEFLSPEMNEILDKNVSRNSIHQFLKSLNPWVIDIWSLGATVLEIVVGCPIWMNYKAKVLRNNKITYTYGLFSPKGRQKIHEKQIEVVNNIENVLKNTFIEDYYQKELVIDLLKKMLNIDYSKRISPEELLEHNFLKLI